MVQRPLQEQPLMFNEKNSVYCLTEDRADHYGDTKKVIAGNFSLTSLFNKTKNCCQWVTTTNNVFNNIFNLLQTGRLLHQHTASNASENSGPCATLPPTIGPTPVATTASERPKFSGALHWPWPPKFIKCCNH